MSVAIRPAGAGDLAGAKVMLADAGLPVADLRAAHLAFVAESDDGLVGVIGLESFGRIGLLRSLVVAAEGRSEGLGRKLVVALENDMNRRGIRESWLLTIDADAYFERLGYRRRVREDAPGSIRGTAEFAELCPGDAVLMSKSL